MDAPTLRCPSVLCTTLFAAVLLAVFGCGGDDGGSGPLTPPPPTITVTVNPTALTLAPGETATITEP